MLVYGELDPWSGGAMDASSKPTSARYFVPGANHGAQIAGLDTADRDHALALAAGYFGEQPDLTAIPRAREANKHREELLMRAARHEAAVVKARR
jgi:hypothetical protein